MSYTVKNHSCPAANENCIEAVFDSGLTVFLCSKDNLSTNYAVFGTKYGSVDTAFALGDKETVSTPEGIAHYLEHKLFESEDGDAFEKYAVTGAQANAYTSFDRTCYLFGCSDRFYENLDILLDFVSSPYFTPETVQKEQGIIGQEIKMYEDVPDWRVLFNLLKIIYSRHPVRVEIAGTVPSIAKITDKTLYDCYNTFYDPSNMFICICGNFDADRVLNTVDAKIKPTKHETIHRSLHTEPAGIVSDHTEQKMEVSMPLFTVGIRDTISENGVSLKTEILTELLFETVAGRLSLLYDRLLGEGLLNDRFGWEFLHGNGYAVLLFEGESKKPEAVKNAIVEEIEKIACGDIDGSVFLDVKKKLYGEAIRGYNDVEETVGKFIDCAVFGFKPYEELPLLRSVTANDVINRAKELDTRLSALSVIK